MTLGELKGLIPEEGGQRAYDVTFQGKRGTLHIARLEGLSGLIRLDKDILATINHHGLIVPSTFSSTSGRDLHLTVRDLRDSIDQIELTDTWDDDPLDMGRILL